MPSSYSCVRKHLQVFSLFFMLLTVKLFTLFDLPFVSLNILQYSSCNEFYIKCCYCSIKCSYLLNLILHLCLRFVAVISMSDGQTFIFFRQNSFTFHLYYQQLHYYKTNLMFEDKNIFRIELRSNINCLLIAASAIVY